MATRICSEIQCPYWSGNSNNYGRQFYSVAQQCHLVISNSDLIVDQYGISHIDPSSELISELRQENDDYLLSSPKYKRDVLKSNSFNRGFPNRVI